MVQMTLSARNAVSLVRIAQLVKHDVSLFQLPRQNHAVLIVNIVIGISMNEEELMFADGLDVIFGRNVAFKVVRGIRVDAHVTFGVNCVVESPRSYWSDANAALENHFGVLGQCHCCCITAIRPKR